jgi:hypothetical protein
MEETTPPITPELALVDADLARRARMSLPDPQDCLAATPFPPVGSQAAVPAATAAAAEQRHTRAPKRLDGAPRTLRPPLTTRVRSSALVLMVGVALVLAGLAGSQLVASEREAATTSIETDGALASDVATAASADVEVTAVEDDRQRGRHAAPRVSPPSRQRPAASKTRETRETRETSTGAARQHAPRRRAAQPTTSTVGASVRRQPPPAPVTTSAPQRPPSAPTKTATGNSSGTPQRQVAVVRWPSRADAAYYNLILVRGDERIDLWPPKATATLKRFPSTKSTEKVVEYSWFAYPVFTDGQAVRYGPLLAHGTVAVVPGALKSQARPVNT